MKNKYTPLIYLLSLILIFYTSAFSQSSIFTYQGKLSDTGAPPTATYQMEFRLFDALSGGAQIGNVVPNNAVSVVDGIFTVSLNFGGATTFTGADRFLQISVRRNAGESFVTLNPRQQIASSPYSIRTLSAAQADDSAQLGGLPANQYLQTNGNGSGLTNLNAASIATGTLSNTRLGEIPTANIADSAVTAAKVAPGQVVKTLNTLTDNVTLAGSASVIITPSGNNTLTFSATSGGCPSPCTAAIFNATQQYNFAGERLMRASGTNLFLGLSTAAASPTGVDNTFVGNFAGNASTTGSANSFFGVSAGFNNTGNDNSFFGRSAGFTNTIGVRNSFFGVQAGRDVSGSSDNSFFGYQAGMLAFDTSGIIRLSGNSFFWLTGWPGDYRGFQ